MIETESAVDLETDANDDAHARRNHQADVHEVANAGETEAEIVLVTEIEIEAIPEDGREMTGSDEVEAMATSLWTTLRSRSAIEQPLSDIKAHCLHKRTRGPLRGEKSLRNRKSSAIMAIPVS